MDATTRGKTIKRRREAARLSQRDLADTATVSTGSVSNLERGAVDPEPTTWSRICAALGWVWPEEWDEPVELLTARAVHRMISIVDSTEDDAPGLRPAYVRLLEASGEIVAYGHSKVAATAAGMANSYARVVSHVLLHRLQPDDAVDEEIVHFLRSHADPDGVAAERHLPAQPARDDALHAVQMRLEELRESVAWLQRDLARTSETTRTAMLARSDSARTFERLPIRVQDVLIKGQVADFDIRALDDLPDAWVVNLIVKDARESSELLNTDPQKIAAAAYRWASTLAVARQLFEEVTPDHDPADVVAAVPEALKALHCGCESEATD